MDALISPGPCAEKPEETVFRERCGAQAARWSADLVRWRNVRGLAVEWVELSAKRPNVWGVGHLLPAVYRLHALCMQLQRFCHVRVYDSHIEHSFRYADANGTSWAADAASLSAYTTVKRIYVEVPEQSPTSFFHDK